MFWVFEVIEVLLRSVASTVISSYEIAVSLHVDFGAGHRN